MEQLVVRDVSDEGVAALRRRAEVNGRSVEAEHRALIEGLVQRPVKDWLAEADRLRELTRDRPGPPSWVIIREMRDS